jgi:hypothetical protein
VQEFEIGRPLDETELAGERELSHEAKLGSEAVEGIRTVQEEAVSGGEGRASDQPAKRNPIKPT